MHSHADNHGHKQPSKILSIVLIFIAVFIFNLQLSHSTITDITPLENTQETNYDGSQNIQIITDKQETIIISQQDPIFSNLSIGSKIETEAISDDKHTITDIYRLPGLKVTLLIFTVFCLLITNFHAIGSLISMILSVLVIFNFTLPLILQGNNPILICLASCLLLVPISFYLSHGFNKKAHLAASSSLITLAFAAIITLLFTKLSSLTGLSTEEARFLMFGETAELNFKGILFGGIMISLIGILDDITITQVSVVEKLKKSSQNVYKQAMHIGQDHIASLINTIFLIYAGAALPTLLLFASNPQSIAGLINFEPIAEEIIRSIIGSSSLILAVPISTWLANKKIKS